MGLSVFSERNYLVSKIEVNKIRHFLNYIFLAQCLLLNEMNIQNMFMAIRQIVLDYLKIGLNLQQQINSYG